MSNYTENFTSVNGDVTDASELETEFDAIATAIATKLDSDGTGTMTGALNMGNNLINNVTDPSSDQDAATKAYVDDFVVADFDNQNSTAIATTEGVISTLSLTIPSTWSTYDLECVGSATVSYGSGSPSGTTTIALRFRETSTGGTQIALVTGVVSGTSGVDATYCTGIYGYQTGETTTGARTIVFTSGSTANTGIYAAQSVSVRVLARRTS